MGNAAPASVPVPVPAPVAVLPVLDLDLDALRRDVKAFATTRNDKKPFNILLIGLQGVGKSSLINTIFRAVTGQPSLIAPTSHNGAKGRHTTFAYHCYRLPECGVNLFDVGGQHYEDLFQIEVLKALLAGIRTPLLLENEHLSEISSDAQKNVVRDRLADVKNIDANNKIDCCIFVVNPVEMQAPHDRNTIIPGPYQDSQQRLFATLCNMPHSCTYPYLSVSFSQMINTTQTRILM